MLPPTVASPLKHPFFSELLGAVLEAATDRQLDTMVFAGRPGNRNPAKSPLAPLHDGRCDGLLLFYRPQDDELIPAILSARVPCVLVSDWRDDPRLACVDVDNIASGRMMANHLLDLGHRRISIVGNSLKERFASLRAIGFRQALELRGVAIDEEDDELGDIMFDVVTLVERLKILMSKPIGSRPTALMCLSDDVAASVCQVLSSIGYSVPDQISVSGFNDDAFSRRQHPPVTTVRHPYLRLGEVAIDMLIHQIEGDDKSSPEKVMLETELVVRGSTAPAVLFL
jgi:LacI family transcriptional regulator